MSPRHENEMMDRRTATVHSSAEHNMSGMRNTRQERGCTYHIPTAISPRTPTVVYSSSTPPFADDEDSTTNHLSRIHTTKTNLWRTKYMCASPTEKRTYTNEDVLCHSPTSLPTDFGCISAESAAAALPTSAAFFMHSPTSAAATIYPTGDDHAEQDPPILHDTETMSIPEANHPKATHEEEREQLMENHPKENGAIRHRGLAMGYNASGDSTSTPEHTATLGTIDKTIMDTPPSEGSHGSICLAEVPSEEAVVLNKTPSEFMDSHTPVSIRSMFSSDHETTAEAKKMTLSDYIFCPSSNDGGRHEQRNLTGISVISKVMEEALKSIHNADAAASASRGNEKAGSRDDDNNGRFLTRSNGTTTKIAEDGTGVPPVEHPMRRECRGIEVVVEERTRVRERVQEWSRVRERVNWSPRSPKGDVIPSIRRRDGSECWWMTPGRVRDRSQDLEHKSSHELQS